MNSEQSILWVKDSPISSFLSLIIACLSIISFDSFVSRKTWQLIIYKWSPDETFQEKKNRSQFEYHWGSTSMTCNLQVKYSIICTNVFLMRRPLETRNRNIFVVWKICERMWWYSIIADLFSVCIPWNLESVFVIYNCICIVVFCASIETHIPILSNCNCLFKLFKCLSYFKDVTYLELNVS